MQMIKRLGTYLTKDVQDHQGKIKILYHKQLKDILNNKERSHVRGRLNTIPSTLCGAAESSAVTASRSEQPGLTFHLLLLLKCVTMDIPLTLLNLSFLTYKIGIAILSSY